MPSLAAGKGSSRYKTVLHDAIKIQNFPEADASFMPQRVGIDLGIMETNNIVKDGKRLLLSYLNLILSTSLLSYTNI